MDREQRNQAAYERNRRYRARYRQMRAALEAIRVSDAPKEVRLLADKALGEPRSEDSKC